jgi:hypothetical protein
LQRGLDSQVICPSRKFNRPLRRGFRGLDAPTDPRKARLEHAARLRWSYRGGTGFPDITGNPDMRRMCQD